MMKNTFLLLFIIFAASSCTIFQKHKTIYKSSIDSTSQVSEKKDSTVLKDIVAVSKDSSKTSDEIVIEFDDSVSSILEHTADDYFTITREGITTNKPIKSVRIKSSQNVFNYDSLANHSKIIESEFKSNVTEIRKTVTEKVKDVEKKKFLTPGFISLLITVIVIGIIVGHKYRDKIKAFILTILPL